MHVALREGDRDSLRVETLLDALLEVETERPLAGDVDRRRHPGREITILQDEAPLPHAAGVELKLKYNHKRDFWENARKYHNKIKPNFGDKKVFGQFVVGGNYLVGIILFVASLISYVIAFGVFFDYGAMARHVKSGPVAALIDQATIFLGHDKGIVHHCQPEDFAGTLTQISTTAKTVQ